MAERLIAIYGTSARALSSSREALEAALPGQPAIAETISAARDLADYHSLAVVLGHPVVVSDERFLEFLRRMFGHDDSERMLAIFLDLSGRFVATEWLAHGASAQIEISCRQVVTRIIQLGARGLILVHNHLSGDLRPSVADIQSTASLKSVLEALDCELQDHLIVGCEACYSMAAAGQL